MMSSMYYKGKLHETVRVDVRQRLEDGQSVRSTAKELDLPYGQVRGYAEYLAKQESAAAPAPDGALKVLFFDIETAPLLAHIWTAYTKYVPSIMMVHDSFLLTWAAKWMGSDGVIADSLSGKEATAQEDERIVLSLADLIREADVIVAHNVDHFDLPMFNNRLLLNGLEPLGPTQTIDTLKLAKKNFRLSHNKLDYLAKELGIGRKIKTDFDLWLDAYHGDEDAISEMLDYNAYDVILLEQIFEYMRPYVRQLTRLFDTIVDGESTCPNCGESNWMQRGYYRTQANTFKKWQCNGCGRYARSRASVKKRNKVYPL